MQYPEGAANDGANAVIRARFTCADQPDLVRADPREPVVLVSLEVGTLEFTGDLHQEIHLGAMTSIIARPLAWSKVRDHVVE